VRDAARATGSAPVCRRRPSKTDSRLTLAEFLPWRITLLGRRSAGLGNMSIWYVYEQGSQKGPFDLVGAIAYLRTRDTTRIHVWREGLEHWALPEDLPELAGCIRPKLPGRDSLPIESEIRVEPRQVAQNILTRKSKFSWAKVGALIGLVVCLADLILEWRGPKFEAWNNAQPWLH
jgi:hypothetical protein